MSYALRMCAVLAILSAGRSSADEPLSPDEEVARREYQAGVESYDHLDYEGALKSFRAAKQAKPAPAFDYNIARCLDRLGRWAEAADAYDLYISEAPTNDKVVELRARVIELRSRVAPKPVVEPVVESRQVPDHPRRYRLAAGLVLGAAVVLGVAGAGIYGSAYSDYAGARDTCNGQCAPSSLDDLRTEVHQREIASGVLWGLAGVALVADVALWIVDAKHRHVRVDARGNGMVTF